MAGLSRGGIELVVKNFQSFMEAMGKVNKSYEKMGKASAAASNNVKKTYDSLLRSQDRLVSSQRNLQKALLANEAALRRVAIATRAYQVVKERLNMMKMAHEIAQTAQSQRALEAVERSEQDALDRLIIARKNYESTLKSTENARTRLAAAERAATNAETAYNAALEAGVSLSLVASSTMQTLGVVISGIGVALSVVSAGWHYFKRAVSVVIGVVNRIIGVFRNLYNSISSFISSALSTAVGFGIYNLFRNIFDGIRETVSEIGGAISYFQKLRIQLETLSARDIAQEWAIPMANAFDIATTRAQGLFRWIANIAVRTPFTARGIAETLAMANAMGLNIEMAKKMTRATIDFVAAMGLTEDHMYRIIYNFGQMLAQGKLNGREFRDLANSFVPVWRMLDNMAKQSGMTADELKKLAFEGGVPVQAFFEEFIKIAEKDFAGAASKMARTLEGVSNNMRDFFQIIVGTSALGPVMDYIASRLANLLDILLKPEFRREAERIGGIILKSFLVIKDGINGLINTIGGLASAFGIPVPKAHALASAIAFVSILIKRAIDKINEYVKGFASNISASFGDVKDKMTSWGYKLIASFANGMAKAISLIVKVINAISAILRVWFEPTSPPRIAKDIDKWGSEMISEWVKGWTKFDISVFSNLAETVESFLRSISYKIGGEDNINLIPRILGAREVIAGAVNAVRKGLMTVGEAADSVVKKVGDISNEFKDYIVAMFDVEAASKRLKDAQVAVAEAQEIVAEKSEIVKSIQKELNEIDKRREAIQKEINNVTEEYNAILDDLRKQLEKVTDIYSEQQRIQEINEAIGTGLLTDREKERLEMERQAILIKQQIRDTEEARDATVSELEEKMALIDAEREAAEIRLEAAEAERELAQERLDMLEKLQEAAQSELDAAEERLDLAEAIINEQIKQNELVQEQINLLERLREAVSSVGGAGGEEIDWGGILNIEGLDRAEQAYADRLQALADMYLQKDIDKIFEDMEKAVDDFIASLSNLEPAIAPLTGKGGAIEQLYESVSKLFSIVGGIVGESEFDKRFKMQKGLETRYEKLAASIEKIVSSLLGIDWENVTKATNNIAESFGKVDWGEIADKITWTVNAIGKISELANLAEPPDGALYLLRYGFIDLSSSAVESMNEVNIAVAQSNIDFGNSLKDIKNDLEENSKDFSNWSANVINTIIKWAKDLFGNSIYPDAMEDMKRITTTKLDEISGYWNTQLDAMKNYLSDQFGRNVQNFIDTTMQNLKTFFDTTLPNALEASKTKIGELKDFIATEVTTKFNDFKQNVLQPLYDKFENIRKKIEDVVLWVEDLINAIKELDITKILRLIGAGTFTDTTKRQYGGFVAKGIPYTVGERGRETFIPLTNGIILPNKITERMFAPVISGPTNITYITNVEVNPSYSHIQSEASVYYDIVAALSAARR